MFKTVEAPKSAWWLPILPILTQASNVLKQEYQNYCAGGSFNIERKGDESPVTQADHRVNSYLMQALNHWRPDIAILSEEGCHAKRHSWAQCWMLDPLDGTKEFIAKRDEFTINLSLINGHDTVFAAIVVPCLNVLYLCDAAQPALKYDLLTQQFAVYTGFAAQSSQLGLHTANTSKPSNHVVTLKVGLSHNNRSAQYNTYLEGLTQRKQPFERIEAGSAYKFCLMLEGLIDLYPRFHPTCEWDTSAGQALLESIGGGLYSLKAEPFRYNLRSTLLNDGFMAVVNPAVYQLAFEVLAEMQQAKNQS